MENSETKLENRFSMLSKKKWCVGRGGGEAGVLEFVYKIRLKIKKKCSRLQNNVKESL